VRYSASVGQLVSELGRAAKANEKLADSADKAGKKQDETANRMAKAGAVVALGLGVAVARFAEFDAAMSGAAAASSATGSELNSLRDAAIKAGADTQYSATEAANAITELSKAGVSTADILKGGLSGALNLAAAGQLDVADAAEIAATAMTQFKLGGDQVNHVADLLAAGANKAQGSVGDLGMALKQSGLVAAQTGLSVEETTAGLTAFASAGLIGSDAGTSFKSMLQRLTPQSKEAATLMDELGISAYDAQGNFIGLEKFAGNLRGALQDLTPEQRNSALATIFGSDAVRAASVIYDQGATGIAKWTSEVDKQGYAAKQAATLTDNLKGDIERLGGSFDTALIQAGSGANDTLRTLVKTAETLVNVIGTIPGPVLSGAAAFGALVLLGPKVGNLARTVTGPLTGAMTRFREEMALHRALATQVSGGYQRLGDETVKATAKVSRSAVAMSAARSTIGGLKGAASGVVGLLGGPWGIALTAATAGITYWAQSQADARAAADALSSTIDEQTGQFTKASKESVVSALMGDLSPEEVRLVQSLGINFNNLADAALKGGPAFSSQRDKIAALSDEHYRADGILSSEGRALEGLLRSYARSGDAADSARIKQEVLTKAANDAAVAQSDMAGSASAAERGLSDVGTSAGSAADGLNGATAPASGMKDLLAEMGAKSEEAKQGIDDFRTALDLLAGGELAARAAHRDYADSLDAVSQAAKDAATAKKEHGAKSQEAAKADRDWAAAIESSSQKALDEIGVLQSNGAEVGTLRTKYNEARAALLKQLEARGLHGKALQTEADKILGTKGAFEKLLAEYAKNPGNVDTTFGTPGLPQSKSNVQGYWSVVNGVPTFHQTTFSAVTSTAASRIADLKAELASIPRNVTTIMTVRRIQNDIKLEQNGVASAGGNIVRAYAGGGIDAPNAHVAEIATSGVRMWAEPETKGEAYIPLANDWRRPRAKNIAAETVKRLGGNVSWNAAGGIYAGSPARGSGPSLGGVIITGTLMTPFGPADVRGVVQQEISAQANEVAMGGRR
jgi:TP901 family phage tail tape measure protein